MSTALQYDALDAETVAGLLGVSTRQVNTYISKGLPSRGEGKRRTYNWPEVLDWYVRYKVSTDRSVARELASDPEEDGKQGADDLKRSERRRAKYMADLKEIELERALGTLVPMAEVSRVLQDVATGLRTEVLGLPTRITGTVLGISDRAELHTYLTGEAELLCTRLSQLKFEPKAELPVDDDEDERGEGDDIGV